MDRIAALSRALLVPIVVLMGLDVALMLLAPPQIEDRFLMNIASLLALGAGALILLMMLTDRVGWEKSARKSRARQIIEAVVATLGVASLFVLIDWYFEQSVRWLNVILFSSLVILFNLLYWVRWSYFRKAS